MIEMDVSSRHKIGDVVVLNFFTCGILSTCTISGIKYTDYGKVLYDVSLRPFSNEEENKDIVTVLKDIDSYFVKTETDIILNNDL